MNGDAEKSSASGESRAAVPAVRHAQHPAAADIEEGMRRGIRSWVTEPGRWLRPTGSVTLAASLIAGALAPCVAAALIGNVGGVFAAVLNQLGQLGCGYLSQRLIALMERLRGRQSLTEEEIRQLLATELEEHLAGAEAPSLRTEMARLLQSMGGVETAVIAAVDSGKEEVSAHVVTGLGQLAGMFAEFRPLLDDTFSALSKLEQAAAEQRHDQQLNIAISERILVEIGLTRRELSETRWQPLDAITGQKRPVKRDIASNPYLGLEPFRSRDARRFFGREGLTERLRARLAERGRGVGILMVIGPSGSGKSSLLRAGLVPSMRTGLPGISGARHWPHLVCTAGADPLDVIVRWIAARIDNPAGVRRQDIEQNPERLAVLLRQAMRNPDHRLLIVVDQFEQMFAAHQDPGARTTLVHALRTAADPSAGDDGPAAMVVLGVRADFYAHCASDETLAALLPDAQFPVPPMTEAQMRDVICRPAQEAGIHVEPALVERIMRDLGLRAAPNPDLVSRVDLSTRLPRGAHQGAVLPLLSHALRATWTAGTGPVMTVEDYQSTGGLHGAVATTASDLYRRLDQAGQDAVHDVLLRLVSIGTDVPDTRRSRTMGELLHGRDERDRALVREVVERLTASRLLTVDTAVVTPERHGAGTANPDDEQRVEISHDALLYAWPTLARWLTEDRNSLLVLQQLADSAQAWDRHRTDDGLLLRTSRLTDAVRAANRHPADLSPLEKEYLRASMTADRSRKRLKRALTAALTLTTVLAVTVAVVAVLLTVRLDQQNRRAISQQLAAQSHEVREANPRASSLLALAAWNTSPTPEARGAVLSLQNHPLTQVAAGRADVLASNDAGTFVAVVETSGSLVVRDSSREDWHPVTSGIGKIYRIAIGADRTLAAAGDRGIEIWTDPVNNPAGRVVSRAVADREAFVSGLAFAGRNLHTLYAANTNGTIHRWRVKDGGSAGPAISVGHRVTAIAGQRCIGDDFKDKTCLIAAADDSGLLQLRNAETGAVVGGPIEAELRKRGRLLVYSLAFSPDGDSLAIASDDRRVHLWSIGHKRDVGNIDAHSLPVRQLAFSPDRSCPPGGSNACVLATVGTDGIRVWNIRRDGPGAVALPLTRLESQGYVPSSAAFVNDGDSLITTGNDGSLAMWDVDRITVDGAANDLAFDPAEKSGAGMAVANGRGRIDLLPVGRGGSMSVSQGSRARNYVRIAYGPTGGRWAAAGDGRNVYVSENSYHKSVLSTGGSPLFDASDVEVTEAVFGTNNDTLYTGDADGQVKKWSVHVKAGSTTATPLNSLTAGGRNSAVVNMTISADRTVLAAAFSDGAVQLWSTATDEPLRAPVHASGTAVYDVEFSPDHSTFFTGDANGVVRRWNAATGKQVGRDATGHSGPVVSLAVSADGRTLASASHDHTVRLWLVEAGQAPLPFADLIGHTDKVNAVAFQPKTNVLFSGSDDRSILRWDLDLTAALQAGCQTSHDDIADQDAWKRLVPSLNFAEHRHMCGERRTR